MAFAGKVVVVTGSSSGIGRSAALMFAQEGAEGVVIHGQSAERLQETHDLIIAAAPKTRVVQVIASMEADDAPKKIFDATMAGFGRIDVLVNNAGAAAKPGVKDVTAMENLDFLYRVNLRSVVELSELFLPELVKSKGCVLNVSSIAGLKAYPWQAYYCMNVRVLNAALDHYTRAQSLNYGPKGVRVNSLLPGPIKTMVFERNAPAGQEDKWAKKWDDYICQVTAMKRWGSVDEMSNTIKFLCSDASSYITGATLVADGGMMHYTPRVQ